MRKTFKYRLFPTKAQRTSMRQTLAACRWVYNKTLDVRKTAWEEQRKNISYYETKRMIPLWRAEYPWLKQAYSQTLQNVCERVDFAFRSFFRQIRTGKQAGYPRFKGAYRYDSFTFTQSGFRLLADGKLRLFKIGDVRIQLHRALVGDCKTLTIRRDGLDNWYACFSCVVEPKPLPFSDKVVGVDLGLTTFAVLSNGKTISRKRWMKQDQMDIKRIQRKIAKAPKGSSAKRGALRALRHAYQRQTNRRRNFSHQVSRGLVDEYGLIVFENLNIKSMQATGNKTINAGIADVAWGMTVNMTFYKAEEAGRGCLTVDPQNTTQACSDCNKIVAKNLQDRIHNCPYCGLILDRDLNAAKNILGRGLASLEGIPLIKAQEYNSGNVTHV